MSSKSRPRRVTRTKDVYYFNGSDNDGGGYCEREATYLVGYTASFKVVGGGTMTFKIHDQNCKAIQNCGKTIVKTDPCQPRSNVDLSGMSVQPPATSPAAKQPPKNDNWYPQWMWIVATSVTTRVARTCPRRLGQRRFSHSQTPTHRRRTTLTAPRPRARAARLYPLSLLFFLVAAAVPRVVLAEKVIAKGDDWEVYTDGRVAGFLSWVYGDGAPVSAGRRSMGEDGSYLRSRRTALLRGLST